jgi:hypothetical protein
LSVLWQLKQAKQEACHFLPIARVTVLVRINCPHPIVYRRVKLACWLECGVGIGGTAANKAGHLGIVLEAERSLPAVLVEVVFKLFATFFAHKTGGVVQLLQANVQSSCACNPHKVLWSVPSHLPTTSVCDPEPSCTRNRAPFPPLYGSPGAGGRNPLSRRKSA